MTTKYRLIEDEPRFGLSAGDVLLCEPYWLDPDTKLTVLARESDGFDPECNVYRCEVKRIRDDGMEHNIRCDCGCAPWQERD